MYICRAKCRNSLFIERFRTSIYCCPTLNSYIKPPLPSTPPGPHNKHNNIQYQFLSVCRLQQLAMPSRLTVVLVSLLLVILRARVALHCPEECWCDPESSSVSCSHTPLTAVPLISLTGFRHLWFYDDNIKLFERDFIIRTD